MASVAKQVVLPHRHWLQLQVAATVEVAAAKATPVVAARLHAYDVATPPQRD